MHVKIKQLVHEKSGSPEKYNQPSVVHYTLHTYVCKKSKLETFSLRTDNFLKVFYCMCMISK